MVAQPHAFHLFLHRWRGSCTQFGDVTGLIIMLFLLLKLLEGGVVLGIFGNTKP